jgi:hypothetical protein
MHARVCEEIHSDWLFARPHLPRMHLIGPFANVYLDYNYNRPTIHTLTKTFSFCRIIHQGYIIAPPVYPVISHISCHLPIVAFFKSTREFTPTPHPIPRPPLSQEDMTWCFVPALCQTEYIFYHIWILFQFCPFSTIRTPWVHSLPSPTHQNRSPRQLDCVVSV